MPKNGRPKPGQTPSSSTESDIIQGVPGQPINKSPDKVNRPLPSNLYWETNPARNLPRSFGESRPKERKSGQ